MKLTDLRYIVALAQEGNFSRAAERCLISQPTLSVAIARFEDEMGIPLFERGKSQVTPTDVGQLVVQQAIQTLQEADRIKEIAQRGRDQLDGSLRLGVIHTVAPYLLPQMIRALKPIAPSMPLLIEENMTEHLAEKLENNEIDVAIIALPFQIPGVVTRAIYDETFSVVVPKGHPWESRAAIAPEEVAGDEILLLKAGNCFRDQVLGACPQVSSPDSDVRLGHSIGTIRCMVASGLGVSVLPEGALRPPYNNDMISIIPFTDPAPSRRIALAWRVGFVRHKAVDALLAAVAKMEGTGYRLV